LSAKRVHYESFRVFRGALKYNFYIDTKRIVMRALIFALVFSAAPLLAGFFPATVKSTVTGVKGNTVTISSPMPARGMSAIVMHNFGKDLQGITGYLRYLSGNKAVMIYDEPIKHNELPAIKPKIRVGDKVTGGYLYGNILLLAPDANTYARITSSSEKNWIHPDLFAMFLSREGEQYPTKKNLRQFANEYQVGLIYIVKKGKAVLYDPISERYVSQKSMSGLPAKGQFPFYMRLGKIKASWFSRKAKGTYYGLMERIK
jgi:hypothetical protein